MSNEGGGLLASRYRQHCAKGSITRGHRGVHVCQIGGRGGGEVVIFLLVSLGGHFERRQRSPPLRPQWPCSGGPVLRSWRAGQAAGVGAE